MTRRVMLAAIAAVLGAGAQAPAAGAGATVLSMDSYWRWRVSWRRPTVRGEALKAAGQPGAKAAVLPVQHVPFTSRPDIELVRIPPPPADWHEPDFIDASWPRSPGEAITGAYFQAGVICMRGRFTVDRPSAAGPLRLSVSYRGGVVVYLNGREIARGDMPDGPIDLDTPAKAYPAEAWVGPDGKMLPSNYAIGKRVRAGETELAKRAATRERKLAGVDLPPTALRKGVNVLAVAIHRADYHPVALKWFKQGAIHSSWPPIRLDDLQLTASGPGVKANVRRPKGVQIWNADLHHRTTPADYGDANEPLTAMRIIGARNGSFAGCVCVSSSETLTGVSATVSDLQAVEAKGTIPASAIDVRYLLASDGPTRFNQSRRNIAFDTLSAEPPAKIEPKPSRSNPGAGAVQPIWLRVNVPADAPAGDYRGRLTIAARQLRRPVVATVQLHVADWTLPEPLKFKTHAGLYQSPDSLAMQYKVKSWSEEHWELVDRSFALLARAGNDLVVVPVVDRTQFGNDEGMVHWVRKAGGGFDYDLSVFDRYMAIAKKHLGEVRFVALQVWHAGGWKDRGVEQVNTVTVVDPATGKREHMQVPKFATAASARFWSSVLRAVAKRLAALGMSKSMCLGILSDSTAPPEVFEMFAKVAPGVGWMRGCHGHSKAREPYPLKGGGKVVYHEHCYGMSIPSPAREIARIWDQDVPPTAYFRSDFDHLPPRGFRAIAERALYQGKRGFGRMGLDYWEFPAASGGGRTRLADVFNRWPISTCSQRRPTVMKLAGKGPDGPASTVRYELLLEGLQEAEAMIFIARAMDTRARRLGKELHSKCGRLLLDRIDAARVLNGYYGLAARDHAGWQDESRRLYETAAEVAGKLKP